jgi:hypothetical protein
MRFWKKKYVKTGLSKITPQVNFGRDGDRKLERFYVKREHIDLLNVGLQMIKPCYLSISQVKKQRNFCVTKKTIDQRFKDRKVQIAKEYKEYEQRFEWSIVMSRNNHLVNLIDNHTRSSRMRPGEDMNTLLEQFSIQADEAVESVKARKRPADRYEEEMISEFNNSLNAPYTLIGG